MSARTQLGLTTTELTQILGLQEPPTEHRPPSEIETIIAKARATKPKAMAEAFDLVIEMLVGVIVEQDRQRAEFVRVFDGVTNVLEAMGAEHDALAAIVEEVAA